jgi:hypothetical protein
LIDDRGQPLARVVLDKHWHVVADTTGELRMRRTAA